MKTRLLSIFIFALLFTLIPIGVEFANYKFSPVDRYLEFENVTIVDYNNESLLLSFNREVKHDLSDVSLARRTYLVNSETHELIDFLTHTTTIAKSNESFTYRFPINLEPGDYYIEFVYELNFPYGIEKIITIKSNTYTVKNGIN